MQREKRIVGAETDYPLKEDQNQGKRHRSRVLSAGLAVFLSMVMLAGCIGGQSKL